LNCALALLMLTAVTGLAQQDFSKVEIKATKVAGNVKGYPTNGNHGAAASSTPIAGWRRSIKA
jgi:hypothetical protein